MDNERLAEQFEAARPHLRSVAYRMLGSTGEAEDAIQESWLRLSRVDAGQVEGVVNLRGWLSTVVSRVCLDMLRARAWRREEPLEADDWERAASRHSGGDPEHEAILADSVGLALLVVLGTLSPAQRLAFVLHDIFAVPFEEIAPIVERTPAAARQLASRARRRVRGASTAAPADLSRQREVADAFLAAARGGDFDGLLALLDPAVVLRADRWAAPDAERSEVHGAPSVAHHFLGRAQAARTALVDGQVGVLVAPGGRLLLVLRLAFAGGKIAALEAVAEPDRLARIELAVLDVE